MKRQNKVRRHGSSFLTEQRFLLEKSALKKAREISQTAQIICPFPQCPFHNWHFRTVFLQYSPTKTCSCVAWRLLKRAMVCVSQFHEFSPRFPTWTIADTFFPHNSPPLQPFQVPLRMREGFSLSQLHAGS